ncbi:MAG: phage head closure protein [Clostridium celatum]|nr:phage head closure protein [Clostridium celatum]
MAKLNSRVSFVRVETIENEKGIRDQIETVDYTCWASIISRNFSEIVKAYATNTEIIYSFRTRYCKFTKAIQFNNTSYKLKYDGMLFNIIGANNYKSANQFIDVKCIRVN